MSDASYNAAPSQVHAVMEPEPTATEDLNDGTKACFFLIEEDHKPGQIIGFSRADGKLQDASGWGA